MSTSQQTDPLIGRLVDGRYRVRARIARGGMATVYVATDLRLERRIALKVMHGHLSDDSVFQSRFIQEARAAARLADPNVVNVFDQGQDGDMAYLVMEYLPGITLRDLLRDQRRLTLAQTVTVMDAVLSGLSAAHRAGIVHRDVKPENVLLAEDGRIKIGDFGLARATTANTATGAQLLGTIAYLAPELVTRGTADARSDIYALGIMLYEMLAGEQPFKGEQPMQIAFQHATDSVPRPSVKNPGVPEQLDELVLWATERSPDDRPSDAREMLDRLREIEHELGITPVVARTAATAVVREEGLASDELTRVLPASATGPLATTDDTDNATRLRRATKRRAAKGGWIFALVVLLTALAAGAGWWFGSGPGSLVAVPDVAGETFEAAQDLLSAETLVAVREGEHTLDVDEGRVIRSDPGPGQRVEQDSEVSVVVSLGPASHEIAQLSGMTVDEATNALRAANIEVVGTPIYFTSAADGLVVNARITPRDSDEVIVCKDGCTAFEGSTATLSVSLGPVPDVTGMTEAKATETLQAVDLKVASTEEYSDTVDEGDVISQSKERDGGGTWRPGDTVRIVVSKGPQLFAVPNVVGLTRDEAVNALSNHFKVSGVVFPWNIAMNDLTEVMSQTPSEGAMLPHGATVEIALDIRD